MSAQLANFAREEVDLLMLPAPASARPQDLTNPTLLRQRIAEYVQRLPARQKIFGGAVLAFLGTATLLLLIFHARVFGFIQPLCESWSLLLMLLIAATSFPPIVGYTSAVTIAGLVYGMWKGWIIAAFATVVASYCCFVACRAYFYEFAQRLAENNRSFEALAFTLEHDGLKLLWMIRLSPLPFSFSNAALSTIPTITPRNFLLATLYATPKLLIPVFIGSRLRNISDDKVDTGTKVANVFSIIAGSIVAAVVGWLIYQRTTERARFLRAQLDLESELRADPLRAPPTPAAPLPRHLEQELDLARLGSDGYRDDPDADESDHDVADYGEQRPSAAPPSRTRTPSLLEDDESDEEASLVPVDDTTDGYPVPR